MLMKKTLIQLALPLIAGSVFPSAQAAPDLDLTDSNRAYDTPQKAPYRASQQDPIRVVVFLHDDLPVHAREGVHFNYLSSWAAEMESLTDRRIEIEYISNQPPYTNFSYREVPLEPLITSWHDLTNSHPQKTTSPPDSYKIEKFVLLTRYDIDNSNLGGAIRGGTAAIASINAYSAVAHELGHLFTATHERAEVLYNGWWCETFTYAGRNSLRSSCNRYSDANRNAIRAYLSDAP